MIASFTSDTTVCGVPSTSSGYHYNKSEFPPWFIYDRNARVHLPDDQKHCPFGPVSGLPDSYQLNVHEVPRKSRIETQVKLKLELVDLGGASSSGDSAGTSNTGSSGTPVTKWNFVKVPKTASVKMRSKGVCGMTSPIALFLNNF
jgi:hypothetical protein